MMIFFFEMMIFIDGHNMIWDAAAQAVWSKADATDTNQI
jgi:hypothetical protein